MKYKDILPHNTTHRISKLGPIIGAGYAVECTKIASCYDGILLIITPNMHIAYSLQSEMKQFSKLPILLFPDWEILPYDNLSVDKKITSSRIAMLNKLQNMQNGIIIISLNTIMQRVLSKNFLNLHTLKVETGKVISASNLKNYLINANYRHVKQVMSSGEYHYHKSIFDIYPIGLNNVVRLNIANQIVANMQIINCMTGDILKQINYVDLLPAHEILISHHTRDIFINNWQHLFANKNKDYHVYQQVSKGIRPIGIEYWQPLFFDNQELTSLLDYFPQQTLIIMYENAEYYASKFWLEIKIRYDNLIVKTNNLGLKPDLLWIKPNDLFQQLKSWPKIIFHSKKLKVKGPLVQLGYQPLPDLMIKKTDNNKHAFTKLNEFMKTFSGKIIFSAKNNGCLQKLAALLLEIKIYPKLINQLIEISDHSDNYYFMIGPCDIGFIDYLNNLALICEKNVFSEQIISEYDCINNDNNQIICHAPDLQIGQLIVHVDHGIGRYLGLTVIEHNNILKEYLVIAYHNNDKLYVPVSALHLINYYPNVNGKSITLNKLGTDAWTRATKKTAIKIRDIAADLLNIQAQRKSKNGYCFQLYQSQYQLFCEKFPFPTTKDQLTAINEVLHDMCNSSAMDRLICGDVGFGKTEIAMRAAYLAVLNKKQVAVLVPTTLLAQQHYDNFCDRFADFNVRIGMLSRFVSINEQHQVLEKIQTNKIDIIIGTHKILNKQIKWFDLGLLIIDEEHHFGVSHKESIKSTYYHIDILTLTATPIPRTLNILMNGIRDLSLINTPPKNRLPVRTCVFKYNIEIIREAILREISRGGQVFYVCNTIKQIKKSFPLLIKLVPEANFVVAHAQMNELYLENVMNDFHYKRFNVLVCTTIIETGINIPNVNTIIIEQAHKFGLAQLYQLRGRVGRSHRQSYACLFTSNDEDLSDDAIKRLEVISSLAELGSGFELANHDLAIRGAGEILGSEQSGQIDNIGYYLYMEMLNNAINIIKSGKEPAIQNIIKQEQIEIELNLPALLPEKFIKDINQRLMFYTKLHNINTHHEIDHFASDLIAKFGKLPNAAKNLIEIAKIRILAKKVGICCIKSKNIGGYIEFQKNNMINAANVVKMLHKFPGILSLTGTNKLKFNQVIIHDQERINWIQELINQLAANTS